MPETTATPLSRTIELQLSGQPATNNRWGSGHINPTHAVIAYLDNQRTAHLYGTWIREDGHKTDAPVDQLYRHDDTWPNWLTALADKHTPAVAQPTAAEAQGECFCALRSPEDFDGPAEDCPEHGNPMILGYCPLSQYEEWRKENDRLRAERDEARQECTELGQQHDCAMDEARGRLAQADKAYAQLLAERNRLRAELDEARRNTP